MQLPCVSLVNSKDFFLLIIDYTVVDPTIRMSHMDKYWGVERVHEIKNHIIELVRIFQWMTGTTLN
jgi:hypothetical protein